MARPPADPEVEGRTAFWAEIGRRVRDARMTEAQFGERIGISPQGLSSWKRRHHFRRQSLPMAAQLLKWPELDEDSAQKQFGLELINGRVSSRGQATPDKFIKALRQANKSYRRNLGAFSRYAKQSLPVLDALEEGGFFAFSACTSSPYEFEKTDEGRAVSLTIAAAINRGVLCLYIRPTEKGGAYYTRRWAYGRVVKHEEAVKEMEAFRAQVKADLQAGVGHAGPGASKRTPQDAERLVYERLDQCYVDRSPMWMPGVGLSMLGQFRAPELTARMAITLPGGKFGGLMIYPHYYLLEVRFGRFLHKVVLDACKEVKAMQQNDTLGRVQIIANSKQHQRLIERFYERYSQLLRMVSSIEPPSE